MSDHKLFVEVTYPLYHPEKFKINTNIRSELVKEFLLDPVLRGMIGKGADLKKATNRKVYHIRVTCDLSYDDIDVSHDCGNAGLMTGILMDVTKRMPDAE